MMIACINAEKQSVTIQINMKNMDRCSAMERKVQRENRGNVERVPALEVLPDDDIIANRLSAQ